MIHLPGAPSISVSVVFEFVEEIPFPERRAVGGGGGRKGAFKGAADGAAVGALEGAAVDVGVDGEEVGGDVVGGWEIWGLVFGLVPVLVFVFVFVRENDIPHDAADAVVDPEPGFVPGVEGEEDGVVGEGGDAFGQEGADGGGGDGPFVFGVGVEQPGEGLTE